MTTPTEKPKRKRGESPLMRSVNIPVYLLLIALAVVLVIGLVWLAGNLANSDMSLSPDEAAEMATNIGLAFGAPMIADCSAYPPPEGEQIAYVNQTGDTLYLKTTTTTTVCLLTTGSLADPAFSPAGGRVAFTRRDAANSDVWIIDLNSGAQTNLTQNIADPASQPVWSPDGELKSPSRGSRHGGEIWTIAAMQSNGRTSHRWTAAADWSPTGNASRLHQQRTASRDLIAPSINAGCFRTCGAPEREHRRESLSVVVAGWNAHPVRPRRTRPMFYKVLTVADDDPLQAHQLIANGDHWVERSPVADGGTVRLRHGWGAAYAPVPAEQRLGRDRVMVEGREHLRLVDAAAMIRRLAVIVALLIPAVILGAWLLSEQLPVWTAPQQWWITPADAPAACAAVGTLTAYGATRVNETPAVPPAEALNRAEKAIQWQYQLPAPPERFSDPLLVRGRFNAEQRTAWLITAALDVGGSIVYLDAATGDPLAVIAAVSPNATCAFDLRGVLVDMARSRAFLLFAGYVGVLIIGGVALLISRQIRKRRSIS